VSLLAAFKYSETVVAVGATIAVCTGAFLLFEKVTGAIGTWFERRFSNSLEPTQDSLAEVKQSLSNSDAYQRYHLGPNGSYEPVWRRLKTVEEQIQVLTERDIRIRGLINLTDARPVDPESDRGER